MPLHKKMKAKKFKKNSHKTISLSTEDLKYLIENTNYDAAEIGEWFSGFIEDNPDGTLNKKKMMGMYTAVLSEAKAKVFVDQIFDKFDTDNSGEIDFKEFMLATNMSDSTSSEEKLRWAFKMYDQDSSGSIDVKEMVEIVGNLYEMEGVCKESAIEKAIIVFEKLDVNDDGELNEDEFVEGCLRDESLANLLNTGASDSVEEVKDD